MALISGWILSLKLLTHGTSNSCLAHSKITQNEYREVPHTPSLPNDEQESEIL
jgi:hypothetical protein